MDPEGVIEGQRRGLKIEASQPKQGERNAEVVHLILSLQLLGLLSF